MTKNKFEAVVFDLDGVITKTAATHSRAWKKMFDEYLMTLANADGNEFIEFTPQDYLTYVDGKPRYEGVKSFLDSRNISLPYGDPSDGGEKDTICGLGNRKNEAFNEVLAKEGVEVYPSTVKLLEQLKRDNIRIGVASSSKNAQSVLEAAGLMHFIETRVDGVVSAEIGLNGKPAPDIFLTAANNLGVDPNLTIVVEDAVSGVQAGKNGNFGLVLGLARENNNEALKANGADIVLNDLEEISIEEINQWFEVGIEKDNWQLSYNDYKPSKEKSREALLAVGNGYMGIRGAMEETIAGEYNYPGTYIAGLYNRLTTKVSNKDIVNEDFVCAPNWINITFKIDDGDWINPNKIVIDKIHRELNLKSGLLSRVMEITDQENRKTRIESYRVGSMANPNMAAIKYSITPLNYEGRITISSILDGTVINDGVKRYRDLNQQHLETVNQGGDEGVSWLTVKTNQSEIEITEAAKIKLYGSNSFSSKIATDEGIVYTYIECNAELNNKLTIEKLVSVVDSNNMGANTKNKALNLLKGYSSFDEIFTDSKNEWFQIWNKVDIKILGDRISQKMLRLHIYHLIVSASPHNKNIDAGITARGLHGEAYRGHIFWDDLFIMPFYDLHFTETARSLLMYRYKRLQKARDYAKECGYRGAMFPWQSGSDGREETQIIHLNPISGEWGDDYSSLQRHVSLAVAYNIYYYFHITDDGEFMNMYGGEMYFEICRFWESKSVLNNKTGRYSIDKVMGPDEFHESYPDAHEGGLKDNAYTNIMVAWMFNKASNIYDNLDNDAKVKLQQDIGLDKNEIKKWSIISSKLNLVINDEGIISQYDGYFELKELNWDYYRSKYGDIHRMDRILKAEGKSADNYKVAKQADTLMTYYNLEDEEINNIISNLGYDLPKDYLEKNLHYYLKRTSHGSTLSRVVHAQLANIIDDKKLSWNLYIDALTSDYNDIQGGTTAEGIHAGVMAGTIMIAITTFGGVDLRGKLLKINPNLPNHWKQLSFNITFKKVNYQMEISSEKIVIYSNKTVNVIVKNKELELVCDKKTEFLINK
ncbi:MAG: beta-phosphoglucomutase family hydrolase [Lentimicrobiaceae bacterium]|jgi:beta-phosphoglucomutase family hydrolase|nr:beta-phosphoglucomutase family hydrolase [Lentimicrobiaceae bacterium]MBT3454215.1 beta-phosphoglucomutase family hydrolase [Lentimicrobiaceae bacterium]MBT3819240.1 beta-phosphoglucomutase family hydrolase [Lentimicrobiaceae bacterium]MBT4060375.1 beta-phosphoglucomutase family hydrolase [Lentimicrobiaceae bacterium]MBT4191494.1 beta-phosphoglucomutase family hydrolase [Lentimicrobiaceae bacterium]